MGDSNENIMLKKKQIDENYQKCQKILVDLNEKKERFIKELDDSRNMQHNLMKELADINVEIEKYRENIDRFIHENPKLGLEELEKKCRLVISRFFDDLTVNNQGNMNDSNKKKISFKIEFGKISISKKIEDDSMTFRRLKQETRLQFDKGENEFFFADELGSIYLDELNVKKALFPLDNINIRGYEPIIKVVERKNLDFLENNKKDEKKNEENKNNGDGFGQKKVLSFKDTIINFLIDNKFELFHMTIFTVFIVCFIISAVNFRRIKEYNILIQSFYANYTMENYFIQKSRPDEILPYIRDSLNYYLEIDKPQNNLNWFNQFNKNMNFMKLIQTRYNDSSCNFNRFKYNASNIYCLDPSLTDESTFFFGNSNSTFFKDQIKNDNLFQGIYQDYDNSGYNATLDINNYAVFNRSINYLIENKWVNYKTKSLMIVINFYNINFDMFLTMRILFENMQDYFIGFIDFSMIDITPKTDPYLIVAIIFSFFCVICLLYSLTNNEKKNEEIENKGPQKDLEFSKKLELIFCFICNIMQKHFRCPNFFEAITFLNFIFFWGVCIYRNNYFAYIDSNLTLNINNSFNDLSYYSTWFDLITYLNCGVILLFLFTMITHLSYWIDELKIISEALLTYMYNITLFAFGFGMLFVIYSNYIAYFIWGDFHMLYYKDYKFIFLKILAMFYRGSIDNSDFDPNINRNMISSDPNGDNYYLYLIRDSVNPYLSVTVHSYYFTFFIFTIVFYFVANYVIKVAFTAYFLLSYRQKNEEELKKSKNALLINKKK